jgi:hypothetical protein
LMLTQVKVKVKAEVNGIVESLNLKIKEKF